MKKVLLSAFALLVLSSLCQAQIEKGTTLLGGNINFSSNKSESTSQPNSDKNKSTWFGIHPTVGVAIKPNTILGIQLGYSHGKSSVQPSNGSQESSNSNYRTEVFLRRYLALGKGFYLFAQPGVYFNKSTSETNYPSSEYNNKSWSTGVSLYPGISYAVNKRFHLEAGLGNMADLGYGQNTTENKSESGGQTTVSKSKGSNFSFSSSLSNGNSITIGFRFFLSKKRS
jgi:hypothetical protein